MQLGVGVVLIIKGLGFMIKPDPNLVVQSIGPVNTGIVLGIVGMAVTLLLLENRKVPAAVVVVPIVIIYLAWFIIGKVYSNRKDD